MHLCVCVCLRVSAAAYACTVRSGQAKGERRRRGVLRQMDAPPSSVVILGKVQGPQVAEAQPQALHVESVDLPLLALQQVFDPVGSLLLKGNQLLFNLQHTHTDEQLQSLQDMTVKFDV